MALKIHKFVRKPLYVDVVRINQENMEEVAEWCGGKIDTITVDGSAVKIIKLRVHRPLSARQTQGFVGDWVLKTKSSFKIYTPRAFDKQFEKVRTLSKEQADLAGIKPPHEPRTFPKADAAYAEVENGDRGQRAVKQAEVMSVTLDPNGMGEITSVMTERGFTAADIEKLAIRPKD